MDAVPALAVVVPVLAAASLRLVVHAGSERAARALALLASLAVVALAAAMAVGSVDEPLVQWAGGWEPIEGRAVGISLVTDPLAAGAVLLAGALVSGGFVFAARAYDTLGALYHSLVLLFLAGLSGFVLAGDLFTMFVFLELMSIPAYVLTAHNLDSTGPLQGALNFAVTNTIGTVGFLLGAGMLYARAGTPNLAELGPLLAAGGWDPLLVAAFTLLMVGLFAKAALAPFHFWHADAHAVAPAPVCALFGGVLIQVGLLAAVRVQWTAFGPLVEEARSSLRPLLVGVGLLTAVLAGTMCLLQRHLKRLLAFSSVAHVGIAATGAGLLEGAALGAAAAYLFSHGLLKGALFLGVGLLVVRFGSVDELDLHGRARSMWLLGVVLVVGGLLLAGMPGSGMAVGKSSIAAAAGELGLPWLGPAIHLAAAMTGAAVLRSALRVFFGRGSHRPPPGDRTGRVDEDELALVADRRLRVGLWLPIVVLAIGAVASVSSVSVLGATERAGRDVVRHELRAAAVLGGPDAADAERLRAAAHGGGPPSEAQTGELAGRWSSQGAVAAVGALALGVAMLAARAPRWTRSLQAPIQLLRRVHSGHPADYVAWLALGAGALGVAFWATLG